MPRKRRKRIAAEGAPDIPYPRVRPVNEGWLYSKDKDSIKLFASYDLDEDSITFGDRTMIPRQWVKKIQKI